MRLWHRQMGHVGPRMIDLMEWKGFVNRLDLKAPNDFDHVCTGRAHGKSHQKPLPGTSNTKYSKMELVIMDLTGPVSVPTWGSYIYALVVVEVSCQYPVGRLLKSKEKARGTVRDVIAMLECQSRLKVKKLQSNNSLEFINSTMNKFCQHNGIIHKTTLPYLPQQNGIAKRAIAILFEMVRCMLHSASLSLKYWEEAFLYATHIWSLLLTSGLDSMVPYEAWTGQKPDISHL